MEFDDGDGAMGEEAIPLPSPRSCGYGHRSSLNVPTAQGGSICILCFSNLLSSPTSLSVHVSYALSQLSEAIRSPAFLQNLRHFHARLLISPLIHALASSDDEPLARQIIDLVSDLCDSPSGGGNDDSLLGDFVAQAADRISFESLAWSRRQVYMVHCLGVLLDRSRSQISAAFIKDRTALVSSLMKGLQLPSEEMRGEILFVLYKISVLEDEDDCSCFGPKLLCLALEALMKTENDDVRTNCLALLTVLARRGYFEHSFPNDPTGSSQGEGDDFIQNSQVQSGQPTFTLLAEAIKGPLLSSDAQVQISALDLIFHFLSLDIPLNQATVLCEENVADYVFEVLRLSENKDPLVVSCIRVLELLSTAEQAFRRSLVTGFPSLVSVLQYVADIPFHPAQTDTMKLALSCVVECPGSVSRSQIEELVLILSRMFRNDTGSEIGMSPETFTIACTTFISLLKLPSSHGIPSVLASVQEVSKMAVHPSLCLPSGYLSEVVLYSLYLLKESFIYGLECSNMNPASVKLSAGVIEVCETHILPWVRRVFHDHIIVEEETVLGVFETFHSIMLVGSSAQTSKFGETLASSSWFGLSFACLGLFPSDQMKRRVYMTLSTIVDSVMGHGLGEPIRDASPYLPSDPQDLLFLLGQKSIRGSELRLCQKAVLLILYCSSLYEERLADEKQIFASVEQFILVNHMVIPQDVAVSTMLPQLVHLYGILRGANVNGSTSHSREAEMILLNLLVEQEWELLSTRIDLAALKWLFQHEQICRTLSNQLRIFCELNSTRNLHSNNQENEKPLLVDMQVIADLVASGDNYAASLLVSLLKQFGEGGNQQDMVSIVNVMTEIIGIYPVASDQFCLQGVSDAFRSLYFSGNSTCCFTTYSLLIFNILHSAQPASLSRENNAWLLVTIKLLELLTPKLASDTCDCDDHLLMGILALILHRSTMGSLIEASSAILLSTGLASAVDNMVRTACSKGSVIFENKKDSIFHETLIFVLLMYFFALRSCHALLQDAVDWLELLCSSNGIQQISAIKICCDDLCKLIYFGSDAIKAVASQCLLELLTRITEQRHTKHEEPNCPMDYLRSVMAVLEGSVFHEDSRVATNCASSLSVIFAWGKLGLTELRAIDDDKWCRIVVEELALSLATPSASKSVINQHKPGYRIATALLELEPVPQWMQCIFDGPCISGIIGNLSTGNVTADTVRLFRELAARKYLSTDQTACLNRAFQACRQHIYRGSHQDRQAQQHSQAFIPDDLSKVLQVLMQLISSVSGPSGAEAEKKRLLEEIESFSLQSSEGEP